MQIDWDAAAKDFGAASVNSMKVMVGYTMKKLRQNIAEGDNATNTNITSEGDENENGTKKNARKSNKRKAEEPLDGKETAKDQGAKAAPRKRALSTKAKAGTQANGKVVKDVAAEDNEDSVESKFSLVQNDRGRS